MARLDDGGERLRHGLLNSWQQGSVSIGQSLDAGAQVIDVRLRGPTCIEVDVTIDFWCTTDAPVGLQIADDGCASVFGEEKIFDSPISVDYAERLETS